MSLCNRKLATVLVLLVSLGAYVTADQYPTSDVTADQYPTSDGSQRQAKIFDRNFWNNFERGLKGTANMFSRVSDNLEVAFDQITDGLEDNISSFADRIEKRVGESMPSFLRQEQSRLKEDAPFQVDAIGGHFGGGVDDGLEVFFPDQEAVEEGVEEAIPEGTKITPSLYPKPVGIPPRRGNDATTDQTNKPQNNFNIDYFNPFGAIGGGANIFNIFTRRQRWWQGKNVCADREEIDENETNTNDTVEAEVDLEQGLSVTTENPPVSFFSSLEMSSCRDNGEKYTCVTSTNQRGMHKTVKVSYRCCHGFVRDGHGCSRVDLYSIPETLETLADTSDFLSLVKSVNLESQLVDANLTVFTPSNEAIQEYTADLEEKNEIQNSIDGQRDGIYRRKRESNHLKATLLSHVAEGFLYAGDFVDEMVVPSLNGRSTLRINIYGSIPPKVTVNCARIVTANQHALNGVIHTLDRVTEPVEKSLGDIISSDPQFSILKKLLKSTGLVEDLQKEGQMTFLAPTDAAFRRLKPSTLDSLLEGSSCLDAVLKQHILPNTICSSAIDGKMKTLNRLDEYLVVERNEDDKLFVEDAQIVARDIMGTNGVLHIIDKALMPNEAKSVGEVLEFHNLTKFMNLLREAELLDEFNSQKDITVFAPSNDAIGSIPEEQLLALKSDKEKFRDLLRYHVTTPSIRSRNINNNHLADTTSGHPLRINIYSGVPLLSGVFRMQGRSPMKVTAGCSRVSMLDSRACGAVVHIVEKMLEVPKSNLLEVLEGDKFSIFSQLVKSTGLDQELSGEGPYTLLIPSDHAFRTLPEEELNEILGNVELQKRIVRRHILREHICCSGINSNNWLFMDRKRTLDGSQIHIRRSSNGRLMAGSARIIDCGFPTGNGIAHTVNRMIVDDREFNEMRGKKYEGPNNRIFPLHNLGNIFLSNFQ